MNDDLRELLNQLSNTVNNLVKEVITIKVVVQDLPTRDEFDQYRDNVLTKVDAVYKEVITMRQEQAAHSLQHEDIDNRLNNLESPIVAP